jgi:tetratricopeptide (TPR) repeat protein
VPALQIARSLVWGGVALGSALGVATPASALPPEAQQQLDEGFRQVLQNPGDTAANASYAQHLVDAGDYEKAIATLERMLITDPSQTQVRVEVGALYFRLGSYETARVYFQRALEDPNLPPALRARSEQFLKDIADRLSPSQFTGFASVGARWESNANTGPDTTNLLANGVPFTRPSTQQPQSDYSVFGASKVQHSYDLGTQNDAQIVSTLLGYGNAYSRLSHEDVALGEFTSGIRFKPLPAELNDLQIRPHVIANDVELGGERYLSTYGFGLDVTMTWTERLASELTFEYRHENYGAISTLGDTQHQTGDAKVVKLRTAYELTGNSLVIADLLYRSDAAQRGYYDYTQYQATFTYSLSYLPPADITTRAWTVAPYVSWYSRAFAGPDPFSDPYPQRMDNSVRLGLTHTIPIADGWSTYQQVEHLWGDSNIPNFTFQDTAVTVGLTRTF